VRIVLAQPGTEITRQVVALGDRNARFLGHFPEAAFQREAGKERIIAAVDEAERVVGYVLFRTTRERAVVQHLCVDTSARGKGVARRLTDELKLRTRHLGSIVCHCAKEFTDSLAIWQRLGFVPMGEKAGRGANRRPLIRLVFDHGHGHLFSDLEATLAEDTIVAVMDLNVALALHDLEDEESDAEVAVLRSDWLQEEVSLWVTNESLGEVARQDDLVERRRRTRQLLGVPAVSRGPAEDQIHNEVVTLMGAPVRLQDASDRRQLAQAIAGEAEVFLTRDEGILKHAEAIEERFAMAVLRPSELVLRLDEIARRGDYAPARLHGSAIEARLLRAGEIDAVVSYFLNNAAGEPRHELRDTLCRLAAQPDKSHVLLVEGNKGDGKPFRALLAWEEGGSGRANIVLLRAFPDRLAETLVRHLLYLVIRRSVGAGPCVVAITDRMTIHPVGSAADALGFVNEAGCLLKWSARGIRLRPVLAEEMASSASACGQGRAALAPLVNLCRAPDISVADEASLERLIWPCLLNSAHLQTFVVPIQPRYARDLFDAGLGSESLFGGNPALLLNCENVYYRSSHVEVVRAPSRVLWYVSYDGDQVVRQLRGFSAVLGTEVGSAKDLFRKYRRLGVYEWGDVAGMTDGDPQGEVMVIRFGPTECFPNPMNGPMLRGLIAKHRAAGPPPLTMPVEIPGSCLEEIMGFCYGN
jgi:ribosomal protein S18 acetylase RimI-like enzyme